MYDDLYQLTGVRYRDSSYCNYYYDSLGNRTSIDYGSILNYSRNIINQYACVGQTQLTYDNNGNLTYDGTFTYTYDCENRLIAVTQGYNTVATYKYDWAGRRVIRYTNFGLIATRYCYDGARVIDESGYTMIMGGYVLSDRKQYVYGLSQLY